VAVLEKGVEEMMNSNNWKWALNKEDPKVKEARQRRQNEFKACYK